MNYTDEQIAAKGYSYGEQLGDYPSRKASAFRALAIDDLELDKEQAMIFNRAAIQGRYDYIHCIYRIAK